MKKTLLLAAATGLMLTACASHHREMHVGKADPLRTGVSVVDGKHIVVDQEPIYFSKGTQNVRFKWQLASDSKYTFPKDGVVIKDADTEIVECHPEQGGLAFSCLNKHAKPGRYKYTIKLEGTPAVPPLDPIIVND